MQGNVVERKKVPVDIVVKANFSKRLKCGFNILHVCILVISLAPLYRFAVTGRRTGTRFQKH